MRYLYGDSVPFPLQYNFLTTLETFVACAARAVQIEREGQVAAAAHALAAGVRAKQLGELEKFHQTLTRAVHDAAAHASTPSTAEFARQVEQHAASLLEDARRSANQASEAEQAKVRAETEKRRSDGRAAIEQFLLAGRLPTTEAKVRLNVHDGRNELSAVFTNPNHVVTSFTLSTAQLPAWQAPRKVSEFTHGVDLQIGVKKSWIKRTVQPEVVHVDDFYVGGFDLSDDAAEIRLRKKPDMKDGLVFTLRRDDTELVADVHRPGEDEEGLPTHVDGGDKVQVEKLWQLLRAAVAEALNKKERLLSVELDDKPLFDSDLVLPFVQRVVKLFAPIVSEVARRSPNALELSLKHEDDAGRREEIYVRKADLAAKLAVLDAEGRAHFAPLGLAKEEAASIDVAVED